MVYREYETSLLYSSFIKRRQLGRQSQVFSSYITADCFDSFFLFFVKQQDLLRLNFYRDTLVVLDYLTIHCVGANLESRILALNDPCLLLSSLKTY